MKAMTMTTLSAALKPFQTKDAVLCNDGSPALASAAHHIGVEHHAVNLSTGIRVDWAWHVQNVNAYHSRLTGWICKFRGVATRYLANNLGWFCALDREHGNGPKAAQWLAMALGGSA